ncbi:MAG TPA: hypothetical protein PK668_21480 [Myxococcota bacterium]|nr:hypothetical protein [Myxococcota bacterium]HRY96049.1 hypothetical protein [Myxococcota bacterium]HSA21853.1 hypothetical protein [Myxococcota bacterium]
MDTDAHFVCTLCRQAYPAAGNCPAHPEEPLLDASDRQVCFFLMGLDDQARNRVYGLWITLGLVAGAVLGVVLAWLGDSLVDLDLGAGKGLVLGGFAGGSVGTAIARWLFKPRYRQFTERLERLA